MKWHYVSCLLSQTQITDGTARLYNKYMFVRSMYLLFNQAVPSVPYMSTFVFYVVHPICFFEVAKTKLLDAKCWSQVVVLHFLVCSPQEALWQLLSRRLPRQSSILMRRWPISSPVGARRTARVPSNTCSARIWLAPRLFMTKTFSNIIVVTIFKCRPHFPAKSHFSFDCMTSRLTGVTSGSPRIWGVLPISWGTPSPGDLMVTPVKTRSQYLFAGK